MTPTELAGCIDHTFLKAAGEPDAVRRLCREAKRHRFASVCVNPAEVPLAARLLKGSGVKVCTVVDFPLGASSWESKAAQALLAVEDGADELDYVVNVRQLKAAATDEKARAEVAKGLRLCVAAPGEEKPGVTTKLILECCCLTDEEKVLGCRLAKTAGFDFVKTSTGFGTGGATVRDVKLLRKTAGRRMGVKAAGGIRTLAEARAMLAAGANRLGCSAGVAILKELEKEA